MAIGRGEVHFATVTGRYLRDIRTGERRKVTRRDAVDGARMADALENVHGLYKSVMWLYDEPPLINSQILIGEMMKNTTKGMTWVYSTGAPKETPHLIKIWEIAAGGAEELKKKPHVLGHVIINPPRVVDVNYTDWMIGFCDAGLPITVYSATMAGATGPATLAGMMVQVIAETVALVVLTQAYKPGHPLCFCSFNPSMDMRTGLWSFGNPEYSTIGSGIAKMAQFYGVPCVALGNTDSSDTDQQTAYEKAMILFNYALAGISLTWTLGGTAGFNFCTWDQMVIDNEVAGFIGHYLKGIRIDEERLSEDLIMKVGPLPGSYMNEAHTRKWYREEFLIPELSSREFFETWERGHTELQEKADYFDKVAQAVVDCDKDACLRLLEEGAGIDPLETLERGLGKGIRQIGDDCGTGKVFLPELIGAADVMKAGVAVLDARIKASGKTRVSQGKVVIGTVKGDIHDIGKSVVASMLQANGYDVVDLGIDVDDAEFVSAAQEQSADCVGLSSLLTLQIENMGVVIQRLEDAGIRDQVKVIVGGAPVTQEFADEIGADAVGYDAADAVKKMKALLGRQDGPTPVTPSG